MNENAFDEFADELFATNLEVVKVEIETDLEHNPDVNKEENRKESGQNQQDLETCMTNFIRLLATAHVSVSAKERIIQSLEAKLNINPVVTCGNCNNEVRSSIPRVVPKYVRILRGKNTAEVEFKSADELESWIRAVGLDRDEGGNPVLPGDVQIQIDEASDPIKFCQSSALLSYKIPKKSKLSPNQSLEQDENSPVPEDKKALGSEKREKDSKSRNEYRKEKQEHKRNEGKRLKLSPAQNKSKSVTKSRESERPRSSTRDESEKKAGTSDNSKPQKTVEKRDRHCDSQRGRRGDSSQERKMEAREVGEKGQDSLRSRRSITPPKSKSDRRVSTGSRCELNEFSRKSTEKKLASEKSSSNGETSYSRSHRDASSIPRVNGRTEGAESASQHSRPSTPKHRIAETSNARKHQNHRQSHKSEPDIKHDQSSRVKKSQSEAKSRHDRKFSSERHIRETSTTSTTSHSARTPLQVSHSSSNGSLSTKNHGSQKSRSDFISKDIAKSSHRITESSPRDQSRGDRYSPCKQTEGSSSKICQKTVVQGRNEDTRRKSGSPNSKQAKQQHQEGTETKHREKPNAQENDRSEAQHRKESLGRNSHQRKDSVHEEAQTKEKTYDTTHGDSTSNIADVEKETISDNRIDQCPLASAENLTVPVRPPVSRGKQMISMDTVPSSPSNKSSDSDAESGELSSSEEEPEPQTTEGPPSQRILKTEAKEVERNRIKSIDRSSHTRAPCRSPQRKRPVSRSDDFAKRRRSREEKYPREAGSRKKLRKF